MLTLTLCLVVAQPVLVPSEVKADPLAAAMHTWHRGERLSGFVPFLGAGVATVATGTVLLAQGSKLDVGAGVPLVAFGAIELLAGLYFGLSSYAKESALDALLITDRARFLEQERARVHRITSLFQPLLLAVEGALTVGGGVTAGVGALQRDDLAIGLGLGLAVQGLLFFVLDWAVLDRAQAYESALRF